MSNTPDWVRNATAGDKVVCVDDVMHSKYKPIGYSCSGGLDGLCKGGVYTVSGIEEFLGTLVVVLDEITRASVPEINFETQGFSVHRFRPLQSKKTDISIFTDMLQPKEVLA